MTYQQGYEMLTCKRVASMCQSLLYTGFYAQWDGKWRALPGEGQELEDQEVPLERIALFTLGVKGQLLHGVQNLGHLASVIHNVGEAGRVEVSHRNPGAHRTGAGIRGDGDTLQFVKLKERREWRHRQSRCDVSNHSCNGFTRAICGRWGRPWVDSIFPEGGLRRGFHALSSLPAQFVLDQIRCLPAVSQHARLQGGILLIFSPRLA